MDLVNTNPQPHTDLIWSFQLEKGAVAILIAAMLIALVVLIAFARKRKKA